MWGNVYFHRGLDETKILEFDVYVCRSDFAVAVAADGVDDERVVPDGADVVGPDAAHLQSEQPAAARRRRHRPRRNSARAENAAQESAGAQLPHALPLQLRRPAPAPRIASE